MNSTGREWDLDRIASVMNSADVEAISRIKLPARPVEDFLAWSKEKTGLFTVRSAYNLALTLKNLGTRQSSSAAPDEDRKLWSLGWG